MRVRFWSALGTCLVLVACSGGGLPPAAPPSGGGSGSQLGEPIAGLPASILEAFERGREVMVRRFTIAEGRQPFYNTSSCSACHERPVTGGSAERYRNFLLVAQGFPGLQTPIQGAGLPSMVLPVFSVLDGRRVQIPASQPGSPITTAQRNAPSMFGVGLFEFVSNATIIAMADPNDTNPADGVSGRFNRDNALNIGRLGYKCQANNIEAFIRGAAQNQMGITTDPVAGTGAVVSLSGCLLGRQVSGSQNDPTTDNDGVPDPEMATTDLADLITFCRFLAPPAKKPFGPAELAGEALFDSIGCAKCHVPEIPSAVGPLGAYTDLLIHDMGSDLADGISMGTAQPAVGTPLTTQNEFRTQPLWGVSMHKPFLHDGRADTLLDAILMHGGEAATIRDAFAGLSAAEQDDLIAFLEAL